VVLRGRDEPLRFQVVETPQALVLGRADAGVQYQFPSEAAERLLRLPPAVPPGEAADPAAGPGGAEEGEAPGGEPDGPLEGILPGSDAEAGDASPDLASPTEAGEPPPPPE
jgi:hypothetical protein